MAGFFRIVRTVVACFLLLIFAFFMITAAGQRSDAPIFVLLALPPGIIAAAMLRSVVRERKRVAQQDADDREVAVLRLAEAEGGTLTATQVASRLGWPMEMALTTLRAVEDAGPVSSTVTGEGVLLFQFPEVIHHPAWRAASPAAPEPVAASSPERVEPAR